MAGRRKVCVWLDEELYEAVISIATSRAKRVRGAVQELLLEIIRDYVEKAKLESRG